MNTSHADLNSLRAAFPALDSGLVFLDWGATGLISEPARLEVAEYANALASCDQVSATWMHGVHGATRNEARLAMARLLGQPARAEDIALMESTTAGLEAAARAIPLKSGDNVVVSGCDYLAVNMPWKRQASDGIELRFVQPSGAGITAAELLAAVDVRTRIVAVSTVGWTNGTLLDLEPLSEAAAHPQRGFQLVVDGIQTFGVIPIDLDQTPVDWLAVGGHKWLNSVLGAGFMYVKPETAERYPPRFSGFLSGQPPEGQWWEWFESPEADPADPVRFPAVGRSYETGGTSSYPGAIGLKAMGNLLLGVGLDAVAEHVRALGTRLIAGLEQRGVTVLTPADPQRRAGIIVFNLAGGPEAEKKLAAGLQQLKIAVSVRYSGGRGGVRVSIHGMNNAADVDQLLRGLDAVGDGSVLGA